MALVRYNHNNYTPVTFSNIVDRFFNDSFFTPDSGVFSPKVDVIESEENFKIKFSVPGVKKDDMKIDLENGKLTVSGERKMEEKTEKESYKTVESTYGSFSRSFYLPENIDEENVEASHEDGILTVMIPKAAHKESQRNIEIK